MVFTCQSRIVGMSSPSANVELELYEDSRVLNAFQLRGTELTSFPGYCMFLL